MRVVLKKVVAGYGFGDVLRGLDLEAPSGEITCLIGPNGAGKSTVLRVVSGLLRPRRGSVVLGDREITGFSPRRLLELGVVHVPQERSLFPLMTVWDNMLMGGYVIKDRHEVRRRAGAAAEVFPICRERAAERAGSLSGGEQKQVELARTLVLDSRLVLLDEPSIGLEPKSRRQVFDSIRRLAGTRRTVLLVEQNARMALKVAHRGYVLETGRVTITDDAKVLLNDPRIRAAYLGE